MDIPILSIVGCSGSGKTTLLEKLVPALRRRGYAVAVIKHHPHPGGELDVPGKDTWRLAEAGANPVVLATPHQIVYRRRLQREATLEEIAAGIPDVDLILTEGYKQGSAPKIEVNRRSCPSPLLAQPEELVAVVSDQRFDLPIPQFDLDDVAGLGAFIEKEFLRPQRSRGSE